MNIDQNKGVATTGPHTFVSVEERTTNMSRKPIAPKKNMHCRHDQSLVSKVLPYV
jgi:hypothetical protein